VACAKAAQRIESYQPCIKKESPDVETPGLLVKALISSFFISKTAIRLMIRHKYSRKKAYEQAE
jgi:hypothetical protein